MRVDLAFVELHTALFIDGMNFGLKLYADPKKNKVPITMWWDSELKQVCIVYKNTLTLLDTVASKTVLDPKQLGVELNSAPAVKATRTVGATASATKAQVAGPGVGLKHSAQVSDPTRQAPKTVVRKAKFQGEESQGE